VAQNQPETRPYLRAEARKNQLLDAAAAVVGRDGLGSLTVATVAFEAGVSRQWVYEHFSDLDDLYRTLILDRFASLEANIDTAKERLTGSELVAFTARELFALAPADRRILRALVDGVGWNRPELVGIEAELRERIFSRWTGFVRQAGHDEGEARAIVWALVNALFGLADQVERESFSVEKALLLLGRMVDGFSVPSPSDHRGRRSTRATSDQQHGTGAVHAQ
jgi:AcrR family transcriptional regulator